MEKFAFFTLPAPLYFDESTVLKTHLASVVCCGHMKATTSPHRISSHRAHSTATSTAEGLTLSATDSEKQLISVLISGQPQWMPGLCRVIPGGEVFTDPDRALVWETLAEMHLRSQPISLDTVLVAMRESGMPESDKRVCLMLESHAILTAEVAEWHAQQIVFAHARRLMAESGHLITAGDAGPGEMAAALRQQLTTLEQIAYSTGHEQPRPLPAAATLSPVVPFDPSWLPSSFAPWVIDIAERMQCPIEFPAVAAMTALSSVAGRRLCIQPKEHDQAYCEFPHLWGMIIGNPSLMKSPAMQATMRGLRQMEATAFLAYQEAERQNQARDVAAKYRRAALESKAKHAARTDQAFDYAQLIEESSSPIPCRRFIVNDASFEALGEVLMQNPTGTLLYQDELAGLMAMLEREGNQSLRAFLLQAWSGKEGFTYDRIGRGVRRIEACAVSILGSIQPGVVAAHVRAATGHSAGADGFLQRFSLMVWPEVSPRWKQVDRPLNERAEQEALSVFEAFEHLNTTHLTQSGVESNRDNIPTFQFAPDAQRHFNDWRHQFEHRLRAGDLPPAFEAHLGKYRKLVPALALLIHVAEWQVCPVSMDALERALNWAHCLESHAARVYQSGQVTDFNAAHALQKKLLDGSAALPEGFTAYDVRRKDWSGLTRTVDAENACELLAEYGWLIATAQTSTPKGGRTTIRYSLNPAIGQPF